MPVSLASPGLPDKIRKSSFHTWGTMVGVIIGFYQAFLTEGVFQNWPTVIDNELHY